MYKTRFLFLLVTFLLILKGIAQQAVLPVAKFSFNNGSKQDEVNKKEAKVQGINYTLDRFGNDNCAVFLSGSEASYINLGSYKELKPTEGTISLWLTIENKSWSGKGAKYNPIILTKYTGLDDFYEAYAIYYILETERIVAVSAQDSTNEVALFYMKPFERNNWYHMVITYNNSYFCFYINGRLEGKLPKKFETKFMATDSVMIGSTANKKNKRHLIGIVDDVEFYDKVLTESQINELYHAPNPNKNKIILNRSLIALACLFIGFIFYLLVKNYIRKSIKREKQRLEIANKMLEDELRINRALMNPHFIFNSLNTLHNYILMNNVDKASDYLLKFSKLIRKILDSSLSDTISLELEIELIQRYLELEGLRFKEHIKHAIIIDPRIIPSAITIPIMMLQPFIENSIWHGLLDKNGDKIITITFSFYETDYIKCIIEDNGTGRKKKEKNETEKKSLAISFIKHRLELLNKIHNLRASLSITDKPDAGGTLVEIILPILKK